MTKLLTDLGMILLRAIFAAISPTIKRIIAEGIQSWYVSACNTANPFDNFAIEVLAELVGVKLTVPETVSTSAVAMPSEVKVAFLGYDPMSANRAFDPSIDAGA